MKAKKISAAEAKAHFSELLSRVAYGGERFVIERRGKPVAALVAVNDEEVETGPELEEGSTDKRGLLAFAGIWKDLMSEDEIKAMVEDIYAARDRDLGRPVDLGDWPND